MGVSGSGKTAAAKRLAALGNTAWLDADDFHPAENVAHMRRGLPLNDEMRWPWLAILCDAAHAAAKGTLPGYRAPDAAHGPIRVFIACSALKRRYRDYLRDHLGRVKLVFLEGERDVILSRLEARKDHFMPPGLLDSQLADLEPPASDEAGICVSINAPIDDVVAEIAATLAHPGRPDVPESHFSQSTK